jgi:hypothetical protein
MGIGGAVIYSPALIAGRAFSRARRRARHPSRADVALHGASVGSMLQVVTRPPYGRGREGGV